MRVWRICRRRHASAPLSGRGGLAVAGRWHHQGVAVVYTSSSPSLAALEYLVHVDSDLLPPDLVLVEIDIPEGVSRLEPSVKELPRGWAALPSSAAAREYGTRWLQAGRSALLVVPSVVVPQELNVLINPAHPHAARIRAAGSERFAIDARLRRRRP